jgi:hypothetical protein
VKRKRYMVAADDQLKKTDSNLFFESGHLLST